jgi:hypothetical protein
MTRTYQGSCHCGAVRFACEIDLAAGTSRCNCSICSKTRFWKAVIPARGFRLMQGEEELAEYWFGARTVGHRFCRRCGIEPFGRLDRPEPGGGLYAINVACLEGVAPEELAALPVRFEDGRHDAWERPPAVTGCL